MELKFKIWFEKNGQQVFGDGIYRLLMHIEKFGSINKAAKAENMSYRHAWGKIRQMENRTRTKLIYRRIGGEDGGGATLTQEGKKFMKRYQLILEEFEEFVKKLNEDLINGR